MGLFDIFRGNGTPSRHGPDGPVAVAAFGAIDPLAAVVPAHWTRAAVELEPAGDALRVKRIDVERTSSDDPAYCDDPGEIAAWTTSMGVAFTRLGQALHDAKTPWTGGTAHIERLAMQSARIELTDPRGRIRHEITLGLDLCVGQLLTDELIDRLVRNGAAEETEPRARLEAQLATMVGWSYEPELRRAFFDLESGERLELPVQVLGSFAATERTWCWSWANRSCMPEEFEALQDLRELSPDHEGLGALWRGGFYAEEEFCARLARFAGDDIGAVSVWQHTDAAGLTTFLALM